MSDENEEEEDVDSGWELGSKGAEKAGARPGARTELEKAVGLQLDDLDDLATTAEFPGAAAIDMNATLEAPALSRDQLHALLAGAPPPPSSTGQRGPTIRSGEAPKTSALQKPAPQSPPGPRPAAGLSAPQRLGVNLAPPPPKSEPKSGPSSAAVTTRGHVLLSKRDAPAEPAGAEEHEPPTRRASDEELARAGGLSVTQEIDASAEPVALQPTRPASPAPPMKLAGRATVPAEADPKKSDSRLHTRPTPRAVAVATTALRFPGSSLLDARNRRKTTKINLQTVEIAKLEAEQRAGKSPSSPVLDIHLPDSFDEPSTAVPPEESLDAPPAPAVTAHETARPGAAPQTPKTSKTAQTSPALPAAKKAALLSQRTPSPTRPSGPDKPNAPRPRFPGPMLDAPRVSPLADTFDGDVHLDLAEAELSEDDIAAISSDVASDRQTPPDPSRQTAGATESARKPIAELDEPGAASERKGSAPSQADTSRGPEDPDLTPIRVRFERGDYMGALMRAEALLEERPDFDHARRYLESAQELLRQMYLEKLGSGDQVLRVAMEPVEIQGLSLDHRSGFLISLIDGVATIDEILDISGMPPLDALRLLFEMRQQGVVAIDSLARP